MTALLTLVIGNKNYSTWSLRAWLLLRQFGVAFEEVKLPLDTPEFYARIVEYSGAKRVPVLVDGDLKIGDSLAICEYVNERWLGGRGWPAERAARAWARSIAAEMHAGFSALRGALPMNLRVRRPTPPLSEEAQNDIARVRAIWREAREKFPSPGPFLFGAFSIADAMYAPVALRFEHYSLELGAVERAYVEAMLALPAMREWGAGAALEALSPEHETMSP